MSEGEALNKSQRPSLANFRGAFTRVSPPTTLKANCQNAACARAHLLEYQEVEEMGGKGPFFWNMTRKAAAPRPFTEGPALVRGQGETKRGKALLVFVQGTVSTKDFPGVALKPMTRQQKLYCEAVISGCIFQKGQHFPVSHSHLCQKNTKKKRAVAESRIGMHHVAYLALPGRRFWCLNLPPKRTIERYRALGENQNPGISL